MTHEDFVEEIAYMRLVPSWDEQMHMYLAQIAMFFVEVHRDRSKKATPFQLSDFMFDFDPKPEKPITEDKIFTIFEALASAFPYTGAASGDNSKPSS